MGFIAVIPARFASTRLPGKPLLDIHGHPMIWHVVQRALESDAARVIVATDDPRIISLPSLRIRFNTSVPAPKPPTLSSTAFRQLSTERG